MKNQTAVAVIVSLVIGIGIGYAIFTPKPSTQDAGSNSGGMMMHRMPDGSMMSNDGMSMNQTQPMSMDSMMQSMMAGLQGKTGDAFDKEFLSEMIVHHQGAVAMAQAVLQNSKRPELLKLARDIIAAQTSEIKMMQEWQSQWFK